MPCCDNRCVVQLLWMLPHDRAKTLQGCMGALCVCTWYMLADWPFASIFCVSVVNPAADRPCGLTTATPHLTLAATKTRAHCNATVPNLTCHLSDMAMRVEIIGYVYVQSVICSVGLILNTINFGVFVRRSFQTTAFVYMSALSFADACTLLVKLPGCFVKWAAEFCTFTFFAVTRYQYSLLWPRAFHVYVATNWHDTSIKLHASCAYAVTVIWPFVHFCALMHFFWGLPKRSLVTEVAYTANGDPLKQWVTMETMRPMGAGLRTILHMFTLSVNCVWAKIETMEVGQHKKIQCWGQCILRSAGRSTISPHQQHDKQPSSLAATLVQENIPSESFRAPKKAGSTLSCLATLGDEIGKIISWNAVPNMVACYTKRYQQWSESGLEMKKRLVRYVSAFSPFFLLFSFVSNLFPLFFTFVRLGSISQISPATNAKNARAKS